MPRVFVARTRLAPATGPVLRRGLSSGTILVGCALLAAGCAGARILRVEVPDPDHSPEIIVHCQVSELYDRQADLRVTADWGPYRASGPVPLSGGPQPEMVAITLDDWDYLPLETRNDTKNLEARFYLGNHIVHRLRLPTPFDGNKPPAKPAPVVQAPPPAPAPAPTPPRRMEPTESTTNVLGGGDEGPLLDASTDLDRPTPVPYPSEITCRLDAASGPRYVRLQQTPNKVVKLVVDVHSKGDPRKVHEVTWWRLELLDEDGLPMPHTEEGFVDVGREQRSVAEWRLDGSPVILKLSSGSEAGDTIRIRFED